MLIEPVKKHPAHVQRRGGGWEKGAVSKPASERTWAHVGEFRGHGGHAGPVPLGKWTVTPLGLLCASHILALCSE